MHKFPKSVSLFFFSIALFKFWEEYLNPADAEKSLESPIVLSSIGSGFLIWGLVRKRFTKRSKSSVLRIWDRFTLEEFSLLGIGVVALGISLPLYQEDPTYGVIAIAVGTVACLLNIVDAVRKLKRESAFLEPIEVSKDCKIIEMFDLTEPKRPRTKKIFMVRNNSFLYIWFANPNLVSRIRSVIDEKRVLPTNQVEPAHIVRLEFIDIFVITESSTERVRLSIRLTDLGRKADESLSRSSKKSGEIFLGYFDATQVSTLLQQELLGASPTLVGR